MRARDPFVVILFTQERLLVNRGEKEGVDETKRTAHVVSHAWLHITERKLRDETRWYAASRMIICSFFISRRFYRRGRVYSGSFVGFRCGEHAFFAPSTWTPIYWRVVCATRFQYRFKPDRCSMPITRVRYTKKKRRKFRLPALSILIGSGEPW